MPPDDRPDRVERGRRCARRTGVLRRLLLVCLLLAGCGAAGSTGTGAEGPPPDRTTREGQEVQLDGAAGLVSLRLSGDDPAVLLVGAGERRTGLAPECRRYSAVRVLSQTSESVELAAYAYRPTWDVEPECPQVQGDPATHTVTLRAPLGDRDVVTAPGGPALLVMDRAVPGRTPVRGGPSCADESIPQPFGSVDYRHFLRHDGRLYDATLPNAGAVLVGPPLGTVRCMLSESLTPFRYEPVDGDAGFVPAGTPYFAVEGRPAGEAVGAVWQGEPTLFEASPE